MSTVVKLKKRNASVKTIEVNPTMHFYASSVATWVTTSADRNLSELLDLMNREGLTYSLWVVPVPHDTPYEIEMYAPKVAGAQWVGTYANDR